MASYKDKIIDTLLMYASRWKLPAGLEEYFLIINKVNLFAPLGDFRFEMKEVDEISKVLFSNSLILLQKVQKGNPLYPRSHS